MVIWMGLDKGSGTGAVVGVGSEGSASSGTDLRIMLRRSVLMRTGGTAGAVDEVGLGVTGAAGWLV